MPDPNNPLETALRAIRAVALGAGIEFNLSEMTLIRAELINYGNHCRQEESRKQTGATVDG